MNLKNIGFILTCYFALVNSLFSQVKFDNYQFRSIQETTSQRAISAITQDENGFIWVGTNGAGLFRYDGVNYFGYEYNPKKIGSVNSNLIYSTFIDSNNNLWVGTDEGLCLYNRDLDNFTKINIEDVIAKGSNEPVSVKTIVQDDRGNLIMGTFGFGLFKINLKTLKVSTIESKLFESANFQIKFSAKNKLGIIYLGTNAGLFELDLKGNVKQVYKDKFKKTTS